MLNGCVCCESKNLSQGDIEKWTKLFRCYIPRVENRHTVPATKTLEKLARRSKFPLYQLFYGGQEPPQLQSILKLAAREQDVLHCGHSINHATFLDVICHG